MQYGLIRQPNVSPNNFTHPVRIKTMIAVKTIIAEKSVDIFTKPGLCLRSSRRCVIKNGCCLCSVLPLKRRGVEAMTSCTRKNAARRCGSVRGKAVRRESDNRRRSESQTKDRLFDKDGICGTLKLTCAVYL